MKLKFTGIFLLFFFILQSCDDGDILVTSFDFDHLPLQTCTDAGGYVFFKENRTVYESLSLSLGTADSIYQREGLRTYDLNGTSIFANYRKYDGELGSNYFCSRVPPSRPRVLTEYRAASGRAEITVVFEPDTVNPVIRKHVQVVLKDVVFTKDDETIIRETLPMGTIENVATTEL